MSAQKWWLHIAKRRMTGIGTPTNHNSIERIALSSSLSVQQNLRSG
jgi:hypothetical protein